MISVSPTMDSSSPQKMKFFHRKGEELHVKLVQHDPGLFTVKENETALDSSASFEIIAQRNNKDYPDESELVFDLGKHGTRVVKVRFKTL